MNPDDDAAAPDFSVLTEAEHFALELRWYEGEMLSYAEWLTAFVERHRDRIIQSAGGAHEPAALLAATKRFIVQRGSVHMASELKDQRREIENELWYRGQKGDNDRAGIQDEWTSRHARAWRHWRIREYFFVVDRCASQVVALLQAPGSGQARSASDH